MSRHILKKIAASPRYALKVWVRSLNKSRQGFFACCRNDTALPTGTQVIKIGLHNSLLYDRRYILFLVLEHIPDTV